MELKSTAAASWTSGVLPGDIAAKSARSVLLFGPDQGGIFEFARLAAGNGDRERIDARSMNAAAIKSSLGSGSLFGGATTVVIDGVADTDTKTIEEILAAPFADDARLILTGGDLKPASRLRKLYQGRKDCVSAPLYTLRPNELQIYASQFFRTRNLGLDSDARNGLSQRLSGDRALAARSCEIVALHAQGRGSNTVSMTDVKAVLDTVDEDAMNAPMDHALRGDAAAAARALQIRIASGESFVALLRIFTSRAFRIREMLASGLSSREAVAKARPPVFWAEKDAVIRILSGLTPVKIDRILGLLDRTEHRIIEQGVPIAPAMGQMILEIAGHKTWKDTR